MTWAGKRKLIISLILIIIVMILVGVPGYFKYYEAPSCQDKKQNQNEEGVDCGGVCGNLCQALVANPIILWQRAFRVVDGFYNVVVYIQNPNVSAGARNVQYVIRLYDKDNVQIAERKGSGDILPNAISPFFESNISTGKTIPTRTTIEFLTVPFWENEVSFPDIRVISKELSREDSQPRLTTKVRNASYFGVDDIALVAILYDTDGNAIGASRSVLDHLEKGEEEDVIFTWPQPFSKAISEKEVFPVVAPTDR